MYAYYALYAINEILADSTNDAEEIISPHSGVGNTSV